METNINNLLGNENNIISGKGIQQGLKLRL